MWLCWGQLGAGRGVEYFYSTWTPRDRYDRLCLQEGTRRDVQDFKAVLVLLSDSSGQRDNETGMRPG